VCAPFPKYTVPLVTTMTSFTATEITDWKFISVTWGFNSDEMLILGVTWLKTSWEVGGGGGRCKTEHSYWVL
jgi:hypothetical protein